MEGLCSGAGSCETQSWHVSVGMYLLLTRLGVHMLEPLAVFGLVQALTLCVAVSWLGQQVL